MPAAVRGRDRGGRRGTATAATRSCSTTRSPAARTSTTSRSCRRASSATRSSVGWRTARTTPTSAGWRRARCRPTRPRSTRKACASRRFASTTRVAAMLVASSRTPDERRGDLDAQRGANRIGVERMRAIVDALGRRHRSTRSSTTASGACARRSPRCPTASGGSRTCSTPPGPRPAQQSPTRIALTLTVDGDGATFDFTGTDAQRAGNVNAVEAVTVSAVAFALRAATDPTIPANGGAMRPVRVDRAARHGGGGGRRRSRSAPGNVEVSQRVADVCLGALAQVVPEQVGAASQGTMNNVLLGGDGWVYYETDRRWAGRASVGRRHERRAHRDDEHARHAGRGARARAAAPRAPLRRSAGGAVAPARTRAATASSARSRCSRTSPCRSSPSGGVSAPWGLAGGAPGATGENWLLPGGDESAAPSACPTSAPCSSRRRRAPRPHAGRRRLRASATRASSRVSRPGARSRSRPGRCGAVLVAHGVAGPVPEQRLAERRRRREHVERRRAALRSSRRDSSWLRRRRPCGSRRSCPARRLRRRRSRRPRRVLSICSSWRIRASLRPCSFLAAS